MSQTRKRTDHRAEQAKFVVKTVREREIRPIGAHTLIQFANGPLTGRFVSVSLSPNPLDLIDQTVGITRKAGDKPVPDKILIQTYESSRF